VMDPCSLSPTSSSDALPIRQFFRTERGWRERLVVANEKGALSFALAPAAADAMIAPGRNEAPVGGVYESCPAATALVDEIALSIGRRGGGALLIDYGYDTPGFAETLSSCIRSSFADVLAKPGASDLSAHLDFGALATFAENAGARP